MQRIKTLIIERQCDGDDCNVGDRHEYLFMFGQSSKLGLESVSESIK